MYNVLTCLTVQHDWRLVALAAGVCFLASGVAVSLFHRAKVSTERARVIWLGLDAAAAGFGIWATHFIAMLAYDPGMGAGYDVTLTVLSLLIAILITGVGLTVAASNAHEKTFAAIGGAVVGAGVAAMHYTGMWVGRAGSPRLVARPRDRLRGVRRDIRGSRTLRSRLTRCAMAYVSRDHAPYAGDRFNALHRNGRCLVGAGPDSASPGRIIIARLPFARCCGSRRHRPRPVFCLCDGRPPRKDKLREQKLLLDAALANMAQGLCMFRPDGRIILYNKRYSELTGLPPDCARWAFDP